jgi:hypothetical protein
MIPRTCRKNPLLAPPLQLPRCTLGSRLPEGIVEFPEHPYLQLPAFREFLSIPSASATMSKVSIAT